MWTIAYVARLPGIEAPPPIVGVLLLVVLAFGALLAGRSPNTRRGVLAGLDASLIAGVVSLLFFGAWVADRLKDGAPAEIPYAWLTAPGWLAFVALVGAVAGAIGGATNPAKNSNPATALSSRDWLGRFAIIACISVVPLLAIGGVVTSEQAGMAVPDWPTSFSANMFLLPLSKMTGSVFLEHAHRLFGSLVGLITLVLVVWTAIVDRRRAVLALGATVFVLISAQGVLGGIRVRENSQALAAIHGFTAQSFFALMCVFAATLSRNWRSLTRLEGGGFERKLCVAAFAAVVVQVALGVVARHFDTSVHGAMGHAGFSVVALTLILAICFRAQHTLSGAAPIKRVSKGLMHTVLLQMVLGALALWQVLVHRQSDPLSEVLLATAHQVVGALVLALTSLLMMWIFRATQGGSNADRITPLAGSV